MPYEFHNHIFSENPIRGKMVLVHWTTNSSLESGFIPRPSSVPPEEDLIRKILSKILDKLREGWRGGEGVGNGARTLHFLHPHFSFIPTIESKLPMVTKMSR